MCGRRYRAFAAIAALYRPDGELLADYYENRRQAMISQIEGWSVWRTRLLQIACRLDGSTEQPSGLLLMVQSRKPASAAHHISHGWPKALAWITNELARIVPQLRMS